MQFGKTLFLKSSKLIEILSPLRRSRSFFALLLVPLANTQQLQNHFQICVFFWCGLTGKTRRESHSLFSSGFRKLVHSWWSARAAGHGSWRAFLNKGSGMNSQHLLSTCCVLSIFLRVLRFYDLVLNMLLLLQFPNGQSDTINKS